MTIVPDQVQDILKFHGRHNEIHKKNALRSTDNTFDMDLTAAKERIAKDLIKDIVKIDSIEKGVDNDKTGI
jgi:hypothetical protein